MAVKSLEGGTAAVKLATDLKQRIAAGRVEPGGFLPSVRQLTKSEGLAHKTVYRALRFLVAEGLVAPEPGRGYRVLARANDPDLGCPIAFVLSQEHFIEGSDLLYDRLRQELEKQARQRGWNVMTVLTTRGEERALFERLREIRTWGVIVDSIYSDLLKEAVASGLAIVAVDTCSEEIPLDYVNQDDFSGGWLAAEYLAERGHERIGWIGSCYPTAHSRARYGGAVAALSERGLRFKVERQLPIDSPNVAPELAKLLSAKHRPTGLFAPWQPLASAVGHATRQLGLKLGKDLDLVGWCAEEVFEDSFKPAFAGQAVPPAVVWSVATMAEAVVNRLAERRDNKDLSCIRLNIPARLRLPGSKAGGTGKRKGRKEATS